MNKAWTKIKREFEENPLQVIAIASFAAVAASKLMNAGTAARNSSAWKKEVERRTLMGR